MEKPEEKTALIQRIEAILTFSLKPETVLELRQLFAKQMGNKSSEIE